MRRISIALALMLLAATIGCRHVGGKCDCQAHPADAAPHTITNPYPSGPAAAPAPKGN